MASPPLSELIDAARAAPADVAVLRNLVNGAVQSKDPTPALDYLAAADPAPFDNLSRISTARLLFNNGREAAARKWWEET